MYYFFIILSCLFVYAAGFNFSNDIKTFFFWSLAVVCLLIAGKLM